MNGLREAKQKYIDQNNLEPGEAPAIVPLNYVAGAAIGGGGDPAGSLVQLRRMEEEALDRPLSFTGILAMMIKGEVSTIIANGASIPPSYCMQQRGETDIRIFQNLVREAVERYFKGQCRNDTTGIKGECAAERLIVNTLGAVESFYNRSTIIEGYEEWEDTAKTMLSRQNIWGYQCDGVNGAKRNTPIIWGNTPQPPKFVNDPPIIGQENVIDWINYSVGNSRHTYKYFVVQQSGNCPAIDTCEGVSNSSPAAKPIAVISNKIGLNLTC